MSPSIPPPLPGACPGLATLLVLSFCASPQQQSAGPLPQLPAGQASVRPPVLLASGYTSATVHRFDPETGAPAGDFGSVPGAQSIHRGPDGLLYVCSETTDRILRFTEDGGFVDAFVADDPGTPQNETGGLKGPTAAVFGPTGHLYVASFGNDRVLEYDGLTGAFLRRFVDGVGGLDGPDAGMTFGSDGALWVPSFNSNQVLRYDGSTGAYLGVFADAGSGLSRPRVVLFRGGLVWVSSWGSDQVLRYDQQGNLVDVFATTVRPTGMAFGPHDRDLYVTSDANDYVKRFDGTTGALVAKPVGNNGPLLDGGVYLYFLR